jgi:PPOX class probable FMN-dependent enzyme
MTVDLRSRYDVPKENAIKKEITRLEKHSKAFIALSPFLVLASAGEGGRLDTSPKGDYPGFVRVLDDTTIAIPDRPGNNRLDTLQNLNVDPHVAMIFFLPGMNETLRITGEAHVSFEPALLETMAYQGKLPLAAIVVRIEQVFFHCAKALIRSDLWNPDKHIERSSFASYGTINTDIRGGTPDDAAANDRRLAESYRTTLY